MKKKIFSGVLAMCLILSASGLVSHADTNSATVTDASDYQTIMARFTGDPSTLSQVGTDVPIGVSVGVQSDNAASTNYSIDVAWGAMQFNFTNSSRVWNPINHVYTSSTGGGWDPSAIATPAPGTIGNDEIRITNNSAFAVGTSITYQSNGINPINASTTGNSNVVPAFRLATSELSSVITQNTNTSGILPYDNAMNPNESYYVTNIPGAQQMGHISGTLTPQAVLFLPTSSAFIGGKNKDGDYYAPGARVASVYFAFAGTPDNPAFNTAQSVGTINLNFYPYSGADLNNMSPTTADESGGTAIPALNTSTGVWQ